MRSDEILEAVDDLYRVTALHTYRKTAGVLFDAVPMGSFASIQAIDRVLHERGALSPGSTAGIERPWYMHNGQEDNLVVLTGFRDIELFRDDRLIRFRVTPERIEKDGVILAARPAMLSWPTNVYHRIVSSPENGSASINLAVRHPWFDLRTEFNIYDLDTTTGRARIIRAGHLDQSGE
jgi:hypothetical protein